VSVRACAPLPWIDLRPVEGWARPSVRKGALLGRLEEGDLRRELEAAGVLQGLASRGYPRVSFRITAEGDEHRLRLLAPGEVAPLLDLRLQESTALLKDPVHLHLSLEMLSFLSVPGLVMQDPRGSFGLELPRLPGQERPGLGLFRRLIAWLRQCAEDWGKDALLFFPPHFHAAALLAPALRFVSPSRQGRFEALRDHLAGESLAEASWAVEKGRTALEEGDAFRWEAAEMAAGLGHHLREYLDSEDYARALLEAREAVRFRNRPSLR
jgi:hypothetical protein